MLSNDFPNNLNFRQLKDKTRALKLSAQQLGNWETGGRRTGKKKVEVHMSEESQNENANVCAMCVRVCW